MVNTKYSQRSLYYEEKDSIFWSLWNSESTIFFPSPQVAMSHLGEKKQRTTVPQFGGWENNGILNPNYSAVFSTARNNKKKQSRNEGITNNYSPYMEFMTPSQSRYTSTPPPVFRAHPYHEPNDLDSYPNKKKNNRGLRRVFSCSGCCVVMK